MQFVALFLGRFGPFGLFDRCLVSFSLVHDPFGQFKEAVIVGKNSLEKQLLLDGIGCVRARECRVGNRRLDPVHEKRQTPRAKVPSNGAYERQCDSSTGKVTEVRVALVIILSKSVVFKNECFASFPGTCPTP